MFPIGVQILCFVAILLAIFLFAYLFYVRISQKRYTEKRFNFIALWSCVSMVSLGLLYISNVPPWIILLSHFDAPVASPGFGEKLLAAIIVMFFVQKISSWARAWNGPYTEDGYHSLQRGAPPSMIADGLTETWRIIRLQPTHPIYNLSQAIGSSPILPDPISVTQFHDHVLDLILGKWSEYMVSPDDWIEEAKCWQGLDTSLDISLLIVCALNESELPYDRIIRQIKHENKSRDCKLIIVFEANHLETNIESISNVINKECVINDLMIYGFDDLLMATLPLARYKQAIGEEFKVKQLPNAEFSLSNIFVDTKIREHLVSEENRPSQERPVLDLSQYIL